MKPDAIQDEILEQTSIHSEPKDSSCVLADVRLLWHELRGLGHDHLRLAALETRRAGESLVTMLVSGVMLAFLLNGAWLGLMAAGVLWLLEHGVMTSNAIILVVAFNLLAAFICYVLIRRNSRSLLFTATLRSLDPDSVKRLKKRTKHREI